MNAKDAADADKSATISIGTTADALAEHPDRDPYWARRHPRRPGCDTGCFTYDPGFTSTANCSSRFTYIDGDRGALSRPRNHPIEQLAQYSNFVEVCHLLLNGELPSKTEFEEP